MRMYTDDEVYSVDNVFLGPPRLTLPWRARYQAYAVGAVLTALMLFILNVLGLIGFWPIAYGMLAVIAATRWISPHINHDFTVKAVIVTLANEIRAPRSTKARSVITPMSLRSIRRRTYH
ncbi:hypothetical protein ACIBBE_42900 [Streptomyces sp. NPDC051644]|uniref:hypothetical protein n=1 Tax=Streptomyces sp. NPDC051644 TaxID=3365666 RepID=UPI0037ADCB6A